MPEQPPASATHGRAFFRVGLTGGIASGKSAAANVFRSLGVPVIDTDEIAREVVEPNTPGLAAVVATFGPSVLGADGRLDRKRLRAIVFHNAAERRRLEEILHPRIRVQMNELSAVSGGPYQILVIPLLVETGLKPSVDRVLVVDCAPAVQIARLMQRDASSEEEARSVLAAQASRNERLAQADDVIANDSDVAALANKVRELDARYRKLAAERADAARRRT
ncbi:MAG TPA: dephospho-CoA kinase [Steroidobacteraceae bacterium]|nr:dephospho-CoA kinase [Steroidobacteraceae bacterium]